MHNHYSHYVTMSIIMILSGLLSTMNIWVDKIDHIRLSINDLYMILLMTGWMLLFMGIVDANTNIVIIGILIVSVSFICIRKQLFVSENQYRLGMIPHHSMAVHMSKKLLERPNNIREFVKNIVDTQEREIEFLKN